MGSQTKKRQVITETEAQESAYVWHAHDWREALSMQQVDEKGLAQKEVEKRIFRLWGDYL